MADDFIARREIAELRRELVLLKQRTAPTGTGLGTNVGTQYQQNQTWNRQVGFPAELTSTYDATTGYSWKALARSLSAAELTDPSPQAIGNNAVEVTGDETLESGAVVWMEPDPMGVGYEFTVGGGGGDCCGTQCSALASITTDACLLATIISAAGLCAGVETGQEVQLATDEDETLWESGDETFTTPEGEWTVYYDWPDGACCPRLRLTSTGSGGGTITLRFLGCVNGKYRFAGWGETLCGTEEESEPCDDNSFIVEVECIGDGHCIGYVDPELITCYDSDPEKWTIRETLTVTVTNATGGFAGMLGMSFPITFGSAPFGYPTQWNGYGQWTWPGGGSFPNMCVWFGSEPCKGESGEDMLIAFGVYTRFASADCVAESYGTQGGTSSFTNPPFLLTFNWSGTISNIFVGPMTGDLEFTVTE